MLTLAFSGENIKQGFLELPVDYLLASRGVSNYVSHSENAGDAGQLKHFNNNLLEGNGKSIFQGKLGNGKVEHYNIAKNKPEFKVKADVDPWDGKSVLFVITVLIVLMLLTFAYFKAKKFKE